MCWGGQTLKLSRETRQGIQETSIPTKVRQLSEGKNIEVVKEM